VNEIKPYVINVSAVDSRGNMTEVASSWAVDLEVLVGDKKVADRYASFGKVRKWIARHAIGEFTGRLDGRLGPPLFFLVCSKDYVRNPDVSVDSEEDISRALVQGRYDEQAAKDYVIDIVNASPEGSIEAVEEYLSDYFDVTPWTSD